MPSYSDIFQQSSDQPPQTIDNRQYDVVDAAPQAKYRPNSDTKASAMAAASMKLLQDHHLLSKKRTKQAHQQQATPSKLAKLEPQQQQQSGELENRLWDPQDEYDPAIPNSYEALLAAGRVVMAPISTKRNSTTITTTIATNLNLTAKHEKTQTIVKFSQIPPPPMMGSAGLVETTIIQPQIPQSSQSQQQQQAEHETRVLLLQNMVGPGEVDDDLQAETSEECKKYGQVIKCLIYEIPNKKVPDDEAVRIFVEFGDKEATRQAISDLNGRYFGGRVVRATYYSLERFQRYDLGSSGA